MKIINKRLKQKGETIVEVLLAMAVLGSAIGGAFAISSRSKSTVQANQERYQAQLIANSQADSLKVYMSQSNNIYDTDIKCFINGSVKTEDSDCQNYNNLYTISISPKGNNIFVINVRWDSLIGGQDKVELVYGT